MLLTSRKKYTIGDDMKCWSLKPEDAEDRERWWTLIEIGSLQTGHPHRTTTVWVWKVWKLTSKIIRFLQICLF